MEKDAGRVWRHPCISFLMPLPSQEESQRINTFFPQQGKCYNRCTMFLTMEALQRFFIGGWSHRHPLPRRAPNLISQKESRCGAQIILLAQSRPDEPLLSAWEKWEHPQNRSSQVASLQTCLSKKTVTLFCTRVENQDLKPMK